MQKYCHTIVVLSNISYNQMWEYSISPHFLDEPITGSGKIEYLGHQTIDPVKVPVQNPLRLKKKQAQKEKKPHGSLLILWPADNIILIFLIALTEATLCSLLYCYTPTRVSSTINPPRPTSKPQCQAVPLQSLNLPPPTPYIWVLLRPKFHQHYLQSLHHVSILLSHRR